MPDRAQMQAPTPTKPTIVMVEGAWHWAGCFSKVSNHLTAYMPPADKSAHDYIFSQAYMNDPSAAEVFQILAASADGKGVTLDKSKPTCPAPRA